MNIIDNNLDKINIIKRNQVKNCASIMSKYNFIKKVIIFGSSVNNDCTEDSDIDICLEFKYNPKGIDKYNVSVEICKICNNNCDILTYNNLQGKIKQEIDQKGVVVYELP